MNFNLTIDKKVQAVVNPEICINCGRCRELCPTGAMEEHQKTVSCTFADCGEGRGEASTVKYFQEAKNFAVEAACSIGCPLGIVPQAVATCIREEDIEGAYQLINEKNPLPWTCSQVCDQLCRDMCKRGSLIDEPLNMRALEGYVLDKVESKPYKYVSRRQEKIAVIGSGPSGITAAFDLSKMGYNVTIFEKDSKPGGAMRWGIPEFRLNKEKMTAEIERIISPGIEVIYNCNIGKDLTIEQIWAQGFSACLIAAGASGGIMPDIPGADGAMVYNAVDVMRSLEGGEGNIGEKVVIVGGGGLAVDMARILIRMGKAVVCAAIESTDDLQITEELLDIAKAEGIEFKTLVAAKQIIREGSVVKAVEFVNTEYIEDERGVLKPHIVKGSEFNVFCDTVIFALGRRSSIEAISKVETYPDGKVKIDPSHRTNKSMIFACGDVTGESDSVVEAMASGRQAATEIDNALQRRSFPKAEHHIFNAADEETIYPSNVQMIRQQRQQTIIDDRKGSANKYVEEYIDDILPVIRSAGIEEDMPRLITDEDSAKKVAIAGGGIAGITAAIALAKKGNKPTIFEKYSELGGSYRWLTSEKRIDKELLKRELAKVESSGIEVVYNAAVGIRPSLETLSKLGYEAVLFAIGESSGRKPEINNADRTGVFDMVTLMGRLADEEIIRGIGKQILVTGSDEMAVDIARLLNEQDKEVTLLAPCSRGGLQVATSAVNIALEEGINIITGVEVLRINAEEGMLKSIDFKILENNLSINVPCDTLVIGGGKRPDVDTIITRNPGLRINDRGYMVIDDKLSTTINGVFAIGDFNMSSPDAGRAGAAAIDNFLAGGGLSISVDFNKPKKVAVTHEIIKGHQEKVNALEAGVKVLSGKQALTEAMRCMNCGYHQENADLCMGCGICVKSCIAYAITLIPIEEAEINKWPNAKDIENSIGRESVFAEEVE